MKEQFVHLPESVLTSRRLGCGRRGERVRVDLGQGKVSEGEANPIAQLPLDPLDLSKRLARVRALVVAVLDEQTSVRGPADVIDRVVKRLHAFARGIVRAD